MNHNIDSKKILSRKSTKKIETIYKCFCGQAFSTEEIIMTYPPKVQCPKCKKYVIVTQEQEEPSILK